MMGDSNGMKSFIANDGCQIKYQEHGRADAEPLILIHGFTGSSEAFKKVSPVLADDWRVIIPDLRGHGKSSKPIHGFHVFRLAMDLKNLIDSLHLDKTPIRCLGASLGCAVIWSYCELFGPGVFKHLIFVDQAPLQNYTYDWGPEYGNRSCNTLTALADMQATLREAPDKVYRGTIAACLAYRSHPLSTDNISEEEAASDEEFFLEIAREGNAEWYGKLMADHTALDWRDSIRHAFKLTTGKKPEVLVIASERSGCFPAAGPLAVVDLINGTAESDKIATGVSINWAGHWCYWEKPRKFLDLVGEFLRKE